MRRTLFALLASACLVGDAAAQQPSWASPGLSTGITIPNGAQPVTNSATGTTAAVVATLPASVTRTTYICGFVISSGGTTSAAVGSATVAGTIGGTLNFTYVDVSSGQGLLGVAFPQCIPGSAVNTTIVVTAPAGGAGTVAAVSAWGYQF
jgi:hypothetical protein